MPPYDIIYTLPSLRIMNTQKRDEAFRRLEALAAAAAQKSAPPPIAIASTKELQQQQQLPLATIPEETAFIVWDTETTGLGKSDCIVQLAAAFFAADGTCLWLYDRLWKLPEGLRIGERAKEVHGITEQDVFACGWAAEAELCRVAEWFRRATAAGIPIVAFNSRFDERMLRQTACAHGCTTFDVSPVEFSCLMLASRPHSNLRTASGRRKGFKNSELFVHFFKEEPDVQLHDAAGDIAVTAACYVNARDKGWM